VTHRYSVCLKYILWMSLTTYIFHVQVYGRESYSLAAKVGSGLDSTKNDHGFPNLINLRPDSFSGLAVDAPQFKAVVPKEWDRWANEYAYTSESNSRAEGAVRLDNGRAATYSFVLLIMGMMLLAADRHRFGLLARAFVQPRLFEQFLRQQGGVQSSGWSIARVFYFFMLFSIWIAIFRQRLEVTTDQLLLDWVQIFGAAVLLLSFLLLIHFLLGLVFDHSEWTSSHLRTTLVFVQFALPFLMIAVLLGATLPVRQVIPSMIIFSVLLFVGWSYRLILGWIRAAHAKGVGFGYIIFYFCLFEVLPILLALKYTTVHFI